MVGYPSLIPCPYNDTGCTAGNGSRTGAGYCLTPSEFPNTTLCRITDTTTGTAPVGSFTTSCDASSEVNNWNTLDNRFTICGVPQHQQLWGFNTATNVTTISLSFTNPGSSSAYFSYTQPYIMYHAHLNSSNDLAIFSYDTTCSGGIANCNPTPVQVVDLGTTCSIAELTGNSSANTIEGLTVSGDDQTFLVDGSSTTGQGTSGNLYVITWNRTTGCTYWNTSTGHWFVNGIDQGAITITSGGTANTFTVHNARLGKGGTWARVAFSTCLTTCDAGSVDANYFWQIGTSTVTYSTGGNGCGHVAAGYSNWVNKCNGDSPHLNGLFITPFISGNSQTSLPTAYPSPQQSNGAHITWANDNSSDTGTFFVMMQAPSFTVTYPWDNELLAVATNGSGNVYRLAHTYATAALTYTPGAISQDGKYLLWTTDWDGMLGNTDHVAAKCTAGTANCRTDVFVAILPIVTAVGPPPIAPSNLTATVQ